MTLIAGVDAATGQPVHVDLGEVGDIADDPFAEWSAGPSANNPNEISVTWNVSVPMTFTAAGYAPQAMTLSGTSPSRVILKFFRGTPSAMPGAVDH